MEKAVGILGLGCYVPEKVLTNHDLEKIVETSDEWIVERTGIKNRHIAAEGEATSDMSVIAAERALADAGVSPEEIELVIVATASADHAFPSTACLVQDRIGAKNAAAFDLSAGCSGFVYSLGVASQMVKSGLYKKALIIGAETLSRIMNWEDRNTCVLFGDGAGAAVIGEVEDGLGVLGIDLGSDGTAEFAAGAAFSFTLGLAGIGDQIAFAGSGTVVFHDNLIHFVDLGGELAAGSSYELFRFSETTAVVGQLVVGSGLEACGGGTLSVADGVLRLQTGAVPEPGTLVLLGLGGTLAALFRRRP